MLDELIRGFSREDFSSIIPKDGTWREKFRIIARDLLYGTLGLFLCGKVEAQA